jgi:uncharacterized membrane protein YphA (DoxX/SURF4 family)
MKIVSLVLRLVMGGVWIYAGAVKAVDLGESVGAVFAFRLIPDAPARLVGSVLPFVEIALGILLVLGFATRFAAIGSAVLSIVFLLAISSAAARGLRINCGCFGGGGDLSAGQQTAYVIDIVRDSALLAGSLILVWWPRSLFSLDGNGKVTLANKESDE